MPREAIYDQAGLYNIEVGWSNARTPLGNDVQIGLHTADNQSIAATLLGIPPSPNPEQAIVVMFEGQERTLPDFASLWGSFDRDQVNRMIRMLRKARDEAFGKDE